MYFLYRAIWIEGKGGVLPPTRFLPNTVHLGLCERDGLYLGTCEKIEDLWPIRPWVEKTITDEEAEGFRILGLKEITEGDPEEAKPRPLTTTEQANQLKAKTLLSSLRSQPLHRDRLEQLESRLKAVELSVNSVDTQKER